MQFYGAIIYVKDFARMRRFYSAMLGAEPVNKEWTDSWAEFLLGTNRFGLHAIPAAAKEISIPTRPHPHEQNPIKLLFEVADVDAARVRLAALGAKFLDRPWDAVDGIDPEGNVFGLRNS